MGVEPAREPPAVSLPEPFDPRRLRRRAAQVAAGLAAIGLTAWLAPGLGEVRRHFARADPTWLAAGVVLEVLSCLS